MARKRTATEEPPPENQEARPDAPPDQSGTSPSETDANAEAPQNGNKPAYYVSVPVAKDTYVQASVWPKTVQLRDGTSFLTHEVTVRKRYKDANGDFQSTHKFRGSELYALQHVIRRSEEFILNMRATDDIPF